VSAENVELIRSFLPGPEVDLVAQLTDDVAAAQLADAFGHFLDPAIECAFHVFPGAPPNVYSGPDGFRDGWLGWLAPWASYRTETKKLIDLGERVVVLYRDYARREPGAPEVDLTSATVWTVRDGRVVHIDFYGGGRAEGLASVGLTE
jgi:hypothetical protein